jgi:hypothetical protein
LPILEILIMSVFVWLITCSLALVLFRYNPIDYWRGILQVTGVMIFVTMTVQWSGLSYLVVFFQPIFGILFFKIFLKFKWINSAVMFLFSYEICSNIEIIYVFVQTKYHLMDSINILKNIPKFSDALILLPLTAMLTLYLHVSKIGFSFVSRHRSIKVPANIVVLAVAILGLLLLSFSLSLFVSHSYFYVSTRAIAMVFLLYFLYFSYRKEMNDEF